MIYSAQGVQKANHRKIFIRSKWPQ